MVTIHFKLNGKNVSLEVDEERMLLWTLRTDLALTGVKYACGEGWCGACTVLIDSEAALSCQTPVKNVDGAEVVTIEGLAQNEELHPNLSARGGDQGKIRSGPQSPNCLLGL